MNNNSYVLALDVGGRRIGVALASMVARLPAPLETIDREKVTDVFGHIDSIARTQQVGVIVVGLPRGLDGQETAQTAETREFAKSLQDKTEAAVVMQDEAGTSVEAEALLVQRGKPYKKGDIDAEAAALILRDFLNTQARQTA